MPRIIEPALSELGQLRVALTEGEWTVLRFFDRALAPGWEIYVQPHLNGLRPDFVLLHPRVGIAIFEVKDWDLSQNAYGYVLDTHTGRYSFRVRDAAGHTGGTSRDPLRTIRRYFDEVYELYCPRLDRKAGPALITAGLIFTRAFDAEIEQVFGSARQSHEPMRRYLKSWPIAGMPALVEGDLHRVFPKASDGPSGKMNDLLAQDLRNWLREPRNAADQRRPFELSARQRELVETRTASGYRRVKGPAGSGKSLVLAARAAELSAEGKDVLVVTFNITLLNYLRDRAVQWRQCSRRECEQITWLNFHAWCKRVCYQLGCEDEYHRLWSDLQGEDEAHSLVLEQSLPRLVRNLLGQASNRSLIDTYDAILVDEGQDFSIEWWAVLRLVLRPGGEMLLVADRTQDLYGTASAWTDEEMPGSGFRGPWSELTGSYRMPPKLIPLAAEFAERYLPNAGRDLPKLVQGELDIWPCSLQWTQVAHSELIDRCAREILRVSSRYESHGSNADVVFLASTIGLGLRVAENLRAFHCELTHTFDRDPRVARLLKFAFFMGSARMKGTTLHSFKGWESTALVIGIAPFTPQFGHAATYAALTRLKRDTLGSALVVVCAEPSLAEYGASWARCQQS